MNKQLHIIGVISLLILLCGIHNSQLVELVLALLGTVGLMFWSSLFVAEYLIDDLSKRRTLNDREVEEYSRLKRLHRETLYSEDYKLRLHKELENDDKLMKQYKERLETFKLRFPILVSALEKNKY